MQKSELNRGGLQANKGKTFDRQNDWWGNMNVDGIVIPIRAWNTETLFNGVRQKGIRIERAQIPDKKGGYTNAPDHFECYCKPTTPNNRPQGKKPHYTGRFVTKYNAYTICIWENHSKWGNKFLSMHIFPVDEIKSQQLQMDVAEQERTDRGEHLPKHVIDINNKPF